MVMVHVAYPFLTQTVFMFVFCIFPIFFLHYLRNLKNTLFSHYIYIHIILDYSFSDICQLSLSNQGDTMQGTICNDVLMWCLGRIIAHLRGCDQRIWRNEVMNSSERQKRSHWKLAQYHCVNMSNMSLNVTWDWTQVSAVRSPYLTQCFRTGFHEKYWNKYIGILKHCEKF
jgi:hypothetical protein